MGAALLAFALAVTQPPPAPITVDEVVAAESAGLDVETAWVACGEPNGFYMRGLRTLVLCTELREFPPGFVRFVVSHELAHARFSQLDTPFTGPEEDAADELAAVFAIAEGRTDDVLQAAVFFAARSTPNDPQDSHQANAARGRTLACLADGADPDGLPECREKLTRATRAWARVLTAPPLDTD